MSEESPPGPGMGRRWRHWAWLGHVPVWVWAYTGALLLAPLAAWLVARLVGPLQGAQAFLVLFWGCAFVGWVARRATARRHRIPAEHTGHGTEQQRSPQQEGHVEQTVEPRPQPRAVDVAESVEKEGEHS